jgi:hypothetical protein
MGRWPAQLFVAVEKTSANFSRWDDLTSFWDAAGVTWDATAATSGYVDALCDLQGLELSSGTLDSAGLFTAGELNLTLDNRTGDWSQYDVFGHLVDWLPGRRIQVWADISGTKYWIWNGVITAWRETAQSTIEVQAFDSFTQMNNAIGKWTPNGGVNQANPRGRLNKILDDQLAWPAARRNLEIGDVQVLAVETENTPLEELQLTAMSDGGILFMDADGRVTYRDRNWYTTARADQTVIPTMSGNVCDVDVLLWDPVTTTDDLAMINNVTLSNQAVPTPLKVTAENTPSRDLYGLLVLPSNRDKDLWLTAPQGQALADYLVAVRSDSYLRLESASIYLHAPGDYWRAGIDIRIGDVIEFLQDVPASGGTQRLDLFLVVRAVAHETHQPVGWSPSRPHEHRPIA